MARTGVPALARVEAEEVRLPVNEGKDGACR
jgi:hypothetical protein